jgi:hypothetical protein
MSRKGTVWLSVGRSSEARPMSLFWDLRVKILHYLAICLLTQKVLQLLLHTLKPPSVSSEGRQRVDFDP